MASFVVIPSSKATAFSIEAAVFGTRQGHAEDTEEENDGNEDQGKQYNSSIGFASFFFVHRGHPSVMRLKNKLSTRSNGKQTAFERAIKGEYIDGKDSPK